MTSAAQLQREAAAQRADLSNTLTQLRQGVTPSAISVELAGMIRDSGLTLLRTLVESARNNPVPTLLIGAGLTMLMTRTTGGDVVSTASSAFKAAAAAGSDAARTAAGGVRDAAASAVASGSEAASTAANKAAGAASEAADAVRAKVAAATDAARGKAAEESGRAKDLLAEGRDEAAHLNEEAAKLAGETKQALTRLLEEQPVLVAAIGAALGAIFGAALPVSKAEKELLGSVGAGAIDTGRDALARAKDVVQDELASARIGEKLGEVADKVLDSTIPQPRPGAG
jgi:hypothetical protein